MLPPLCLGHMLVEPMARSGDLTTIQRWYEIEMKKVNSTSQLQSLLDYPGAIRH